MSTSASRSKFRRWVCGLTAATMVLVTLLGSIVAVAETKSVTVTKTVSETNAVAGMKTAAETKAVAEAGSSGSDVTKAQATLKNEEKAMTQSFEASSKSSSSSAEESSKSKSLSTEASSKSSSSSAEESSKSKSFSTEASSKTSSSSAEASSKSSGAETSSKSSSSAEVSSSKSKSLNTDQSPKSQPSSATAGAAKNQTDSKSKTLSLTQSAYKEARIFRGTLDSVYTLPTWEFKEQEDVPYVSLEDYVNQLFIDTYDPALEYTWDGDVFLISRNDVSVRVDTVKQTVGCENWRLFFGPNAADAVPDGIVDKIEFIAIRPSAKNESTQTPAKGYSIALKDYDVEMVRMDDKVLMPFVIAQAIFAGPAMRGFLAFNGDDYYDIVDSVDSIYGSGTMKSAPNPFANMWYSGSFASRSMLSEAYAKYNYAGICLLLDLTYGHKEEKGIKTFDSFLEENGLKEALLTPDPKDDTESLKMLFTVLFDSGHDAEILSPSIIDSEGAISRAELTHELLSLIGYDNLSDLSEDVGPLIYAILGMLTKNTDFLKELENAEKDESKLGPNVTKLITHAFKMALLKPLGYGSSRVDFVGDTCVIYFEGFEEDLTRPESFYTKLPTKDDLDTSSFGLFYYAFNRIKKNGNVKNVVIDLSHNGGGSAAALVATLGFLSRDGEVKITYQDVLSQNYCTECYHVDTNLDGHFDDEDGYGGQYDFYILTSGLSYSCANAFPYFAQLQKQAKIIGEAPGGGDCVVGYYVDAYGRVGAISGIKKLGTMKGKTFVSNENAVVVDIPFKQDEAEGIYYKPEKIAEFIGGKK